MSILFVFARLGRLAHIRVYKVWLHPDIFFRFSKVKKEQDKYINVINAVTDRIIKEREEHLEKGSGGAEGKQTFLDNLLLEKDENGKRAISNEEIRDEVNTLMFAVSTKRIPKGSVGTEKKGIINCSLVLSAGSGHHNSVSRLRLELIRNLPRHSGKRSKHATVSFTCGIFTEKHLAGSDRIRGRRDQSC